ncbi:MAG: copper chaperone PCu(A)C [Solirubrobacterales bacterium]|nr:copper chaperone PCu(A)C [Solirubrobacterales bacterium]
MKKLMLIPIALIVVAGTLAACGGSDDEKLEISDVWSRTSAVSQENGAVYMTIKSPVDDRLVKASVSTSIGAKTEIHETVTSGSETEGGEGQEAMKPGDGEMGGDAMMSMRPVSAVDLPAGQDVVLAPGGYHIMILELAKPLQIGETFPVTLTLETAGEVQVDATVKEG